MENSGPINEELKMEEYRIKVLNKHVLTSIINKNELSPMRLTQKSDGNARTTTEDLETEGRDTVTDYSTVEAFNQLRVRTFLSNKKGLDSQGSD